MYQGYIKYTVTEKFLVISWIQKTDTILTSLVLMWNDQMVIRMRTFQPLLNKHGKNQYLQA